MVNIDLESLKTGVMGLTPAWGAFLYQAGLVCFDEVDHPPGVCLNINASRSRKFGLRWMDPVDDRVRRNFGDLQEATEYGAVGISVLLSERFTSYRHIERASKGMGFDYYLGDVSDDVYGLFQRKCRLEVSGILRGGKRELEKRTKEKKKQTDISDGSGLHAYISVVEFSTPEANFIEK